MSGYYYQTRNGKRVRVRKASYPVSKDVRAAKEGAVAGAANATSSGLMAGLGSLGGAVIGAVAGSRARRRIKSNPLVRGGAMGAGIIVGGALGNVISKRAHYYVLRRKRKRKRKIN